MTSRSSASRSIRPMNEAENDAPDRDISAAGAGVRTLVIAAREDLEMVREARAVLG